MWVTRRSQCKYTNNFSKPIHYEQNYLFLKESNRWKHLAGGFVVGLCACSAFGAVYSAAVAASCLELKDKLHGSPWDWTDWLLTVTGGVTASIIWMLL